MNRKSYYELLPHPDGGVFAAWCTSSSLYAGWRVLEKQYTIGTFYGPPAKDVGMYRDIRQNDPLLVKPEHIISDHSLYPMRIYPEFRYAPLWVRKAAYLAGIKGAVQTYETGYTYAPDRLAAMIFQPDGRRLDLVSKDWEQIDGLTWKQVRGAKAQGRTTIGKSRNCCFLIWQ
jgi:hypothetical protein